MSDRDIELWGLGFEAVKAAALICGAAWAAWRFRRERSYAPQVQFTIDAVLHGPNHGRYATEIILIFENKGKTRMQINRIELRVRGIMIDDPLINMKGYGDRLSFPQKFVDAKDVLPKDYGYMFAEPGIKQEYRYICHIPETCKFLLIRGQFFYDEDHPHSAERIITVKAA